MGGSVVRATPILPQGPWDIRRNIPCFTKLYFLRGRQILTRTKPAGINKHFSMAIVMEELGAALGEDSQVRAPMMSHHAPCTMPPVSYTHLTLPTKRIV